VTSLPINHIEGSALIGAGSKVWWYAVVLQDVRIGVNCSIGSHTEIGRGSRIGDQTRIGAQCFLPPNSVVGCSVFIGPGVVFTDDRFPRIHTPEEPPYHAEPPVIEDGANIGAGAVILPGVRIGRKAFIAAGAIVTRDVPAGGHVRGQPARTETLRNRQPELQA
jgi:UDP-2-acetamido-3-amino-2,3-dideoxy-glucuronate N-acetyltransferase